MYFLNFIIFPFYLLLFSQQKYKMLCFLILFVFQSCLSLVLNLEENSLRDYSNFLPNGILL